MSVGTSTDNSFSINSKEFVWNSAELSEVHRYVGGPILAQLKDRKVEKVLDLGCGNGAFSNFIARNGFHVTGFDGSETGIELAQKNFPDVRFSVHEILQPLPESLSGKFDAVVSVEVIEHLLLPRKLIEHSLKVLKPGGLLILTTPFHGYWKNLALALTNRFDDHWHPLRDFGHVKFFSRATMMQLLAEYKLENLQFKTVGRVPMFARSMIVSGTKPA